nr:xylulose kinase-1 [Tanacetum cinerariifolium]
MIIIIDFLRASHIWYALSHVPIIFDSLGKQFWSTATLRSLELGPPAIQATIDKTPYTITKDLVRSQLQLADDGGIDYLPIAEIYSGMDNLGGHPMPLLPAMLLQAQAGEDPNTTSFSRSHETDVGPFTNVEDEPLEGSFHMSPPRSTQAPPAGQPSGGAEDPITLTALSFVVSTLVQKVNSLEIKLKDHKKLFKDVVGKLVKKVKAMEVKLKTKKRKMVVSDSGQKDGGKQDVDLDALRALANAAVTVDSTIPPGGASHIPAASTSVLAAVPTSASTVPASSLSIPADVPPSVAHVGVSNKGKSLMVEEDIPVKERTFKQMQEDILGEQAAKRLHNEEQAKLDRHRAELQRRRQQEVLDSAIWSMAHMKSFTDDQLKEEFEKIQKAISSIQIQAFSRTLKRTCLVFEEPSSKRQKSTEAPIPSVPEAPQSPVVSSPISSSTRRKSIGITHDAPRLWPALVGWEVISTPLGDINALYRIDQSTKHFTTLRQILHMVDRQDLVKLYGLVVQYYENHTVSETVSGEVVYMFAGVSYPLSVKLIELMLKHKLKIDKDFESKASRSSVGKASLLEDVLSWLLVIAKRDVIMMDKNDIALFRLAIGSSPGRNDGTARLESSWETQLVAAMKLQKIDKQFVEQMVVRELLEADTVSNEKVLHKIMNVVERDNIVEQLVITVIDSEYDYTKVDDRVDMKYCSDR